MSCTWLLQTREMENDTKDPISEEIDVGNIIIETDGKPIRTVGQLNNYINSVIRSGDKTIFITIYNNQNQKRSIGIKIE